MSDCQVNHVFVRVCVWLCMQWITVDKSYKDCGGGGVEETTPNACERVSKPRMKKLAYKSQETDPNDYQRVSKPYMKKLSNPG